MVSFNYAVFGNRDGSHELLDTDLPDERRLLSQIRFIVDRPPGLVQGVTWSPYWGCGPLETWWVLWRGDEDRNAPRRGMVTSRVVMIRREDIGTTEDLTELLQFLSYNPSGIESSFVGAVADALSMNQVPVVIPGLSLGPELLFALWSRLWPPLRQCFSMRTFFGSESLDRGNTPHVVIIPAELRPRWRSFPVVDGDSQDPATSVAALYSGASSPELDRLLRCNWTRLPPRFDVLARLDRIAQKLRDLQEGRGQYDDALLIARTMPFFAEGVVLPERDLDLLADHLCSMKNGTARDLRGASLVDLSFIGSRLAEVEVAVSNWIRARLPSEPDTDTLWILEQQHKGCHVDWWVRAVRSGLTDSLAAMSSDWVMATWRWWVLDFRAIIWLQGFLPDDSATEQRLLQHFPDNVAREVHEHIRAMCSEKRWVKLLASSLRRSHTLVDSVRVLLEMVGTPESGLEELLKGRAPSEIIVAAVECGWKALIDKAAQRTVRDPTLFDGVNVEAPGFITLLSVHLSIGGEVPEAIIDSQVVFRLFDGCISGDQDCIRAVLRILDLAAEAILVYPEQDALLAIMGSEGPRLLSAAAKAWLEAFAAGKKPNRPGSALLVAVRREAPIVFQGGPIRLVIDFLEAFPEMMEEEAADWLCSGGFSQEPGDLERLEDLIFYRGWWLLAERFLAVPKHVLLWRWIFKRLRNQRTDGPRADRPIKVLFLATNPDCTPKVALDEEARAIEEKIRLAEFRDEIILRTRWAVRPDDLQQVLLEEHPTIVHVSGHGTESSRLVLHSEAGNTAALVSPDALVDLFKLFRSDVRMVVLNACYSMEQAKRTVQYIDFAIGMNNSIGDEAARVFAAALYRALGFGKTVQESFDLAKNMLKLANMHDDAGVPQLYAKEGINPASTRIVG